MRRLSLNARTAETAANSDQIEVVLLMIEHPALTQPIRLSTDNADRISTEPLIYGTRSAWMGANPVTEPYLWILASAMVPSDLEDAPAAATIVLENVSNEIATLLRAVNGRATVHMAVVLAATPDLVEVEYRDLRLISAEGDAGEVALSISREPIEEERFPWLRFTKERFPGVHR